MDEHTKEPWRIDPAIPTWIVAGEDTSIANTASPTKVAEQWEANARRIVAAVNACAVYPTEFLEDVANKQDTVWAQIETLTSQRDELLATLKSVLEVIDIPEPNCQCHIAPPCSDCVEYGGIRLAIVEARAAIAKLEVVHG